MNRQSQWLFEAPFPLIMDIYTNPEYYNPEWESPEGSNDGSLVGEEENNYWPSHPYTALEFEAEWELSGKKSSKKSGKASWTQTLLPLLNRYRGSIPLDFLLGWIDIESNGIIGEVTHKLDERGYFQISPAESKTLGLDHQRLSTDPDYSIQSGIELIRYYGKIAQNRYKYQYGTDLYWGIVKLYHWLSGGVNILLKDMRERGIKPTTWEQFKQYVIVNQERLNQRFRTEFKKRELPEKWHPKYAIDIVDRMFSNGNQLAKNLIQTASGSKPSSSPSSSSISPQVGNIPEVHLPVTGRTIARNQASGRVHPLNEPNQPKRNGSTSTQKRDQLTQIINWLQVERSARYARDSKNRTFCNIYAYDYCYLAGAYLPRVWWTRPALKKLAAGQSVPIKYETTVSELNANSLHSWFEEFGQQFGWVQTFDLTALQSAANNGQVCIITAERMNLREHGHICAVVPETSSYSAKRSGAKVTVPLQSQAGAHNLRYHSTKQWWTHHRFRKFGFWIHP